MSSPSQSPLFQTQSVLCIHEEQPQPPHRCDSTHQTLATFWRLPVWKGTRTEKCVPEVMGLQCYRNGPNTWMGTGEMKMHGLPKEISFQRERYKPHSKKCDSREHTQGEAKGEGFLQKGDTLPHAFLVPGKGEFAQEVKLLAKLRFGDYLWPSCFFLFLFLSFLFFSFLKGENLF